MTNYREILRLSSLGLNNTQIAQSCACSRTTVIQTLRLAREKGLSCPLPEEMSDKQLAEILFPSASESRGYKMPDYEYVHKEMQKSGVTLNLLWMEYCETCQANGEIPYQLTQFKKYYRDYTAKTNATMHLNHKPGEILQVDWAGDTASVIDTDTGEVIPAYVFVSTLPYSGYAYVEAFFSMDQECWTAAHVNAYKYFGGVTRILQCDNLKTGVITHGRSEVTLNKSYNDLAEHYGTAILPCRVRSPKDKAMVEGTVGVVSNFILAALRNRRFLSLTELNKAIQERLFEFNHKPFQKKDGSRALAFEEEKPFLLPLPPRPFELATWKIATVAPNYHISVDKMNYSVPYEQYVQWNGDRFRKWAEKIGANTQTVISAILGGYKVEQHGYKACMGLLKLADKYTPERLENACRKALTFTPRPSLKNIQAILSSGQDKVEENAPASSESSAKYGFTRGAEYYGGKK